RSLLSSKERISGTFLPPPDKSITHRALFLSALSLNKSRIRNPLVSGDCQSTLHAFQQLGVTIKKSKNEWCITPGGKNPLNPYRKLKPARSSLNCGNSGTTMRLLCGMLAAQSFETHLIGDQSLSVRPMKRVIEPLSQMGAKIQSDQDHA